MKKIRPLRFDPSGAFIPVHGVSSEETAALSQSLTGIRDEVLKTDLEIFNSGNIPPEKQPLDAAFLEMPERLLSAYQTDRPNSELGQILETAAQIQSAVDRVVVLGIGGSYMGARAIMECCCQPYFNEYSRGRRGGRPRVYFEGNNVDNDWTQGLLDLLKSEPNDPWAIVVISKSGGTLETAATFRRYLNELKEQVGAKRLGDLVVPVTGETGRLADLADAIGCKTRFPVPDGVGGRFSVFSAVGLLPAAILGVDIVTLLEGAATMNDHFRNASPGENVVLDYVAVNHLLEKERGCKIRINSAWSKSLESAGLWYDQLLAESLGKQEMGAMPLTVVNTRDLHSRAQQHQEGRRDKVINNWIIESWRDNPLTITESDWDQDQLNELAGRNFPEIMTAAIRGTNEAYREDDRPTTDLYLPAADEASLGQLFQMLMIATVVEGRLLGINPYGQPGVEKYKRNMNKLLRETVKTN